jgi:hypothetical protein
MWGDPAVGVFGEVEGHSVGKSGLKGQNQKNTGN